MISHIPYSSLGQADHGWLNARHHFSFAHYYHPQRMGFGALRVINDDIIKAGKGFGMHPHNDMEIITYVRSGAVSHEDNTGNKGVTQSGEIQVMSAGSGIMHSEHNLSDTDLTLYQIWITPNKQGVKPRWETKPFPNNFVNGALSLVVSGFEEDANQGALFIHQQARIFAGRIKKEEPIVHTLTQQGYLLVSAGEVKLTQGQQSITLKKGDGAEIQLEQTRGKQTQCTIMASENSEVVLIEVPNE